MMTKLANCRGQNSHYSECSKMPDGIVNFMISVFRLYGEKNCSTTRATFKMSLMYLNCKLFNKLYCIVRKIVV